MRHLLKEGWKERKAYFLRPGDSYSELLPAYSLSKLTGGQLSLHSLKVFLYV
jgi:hypothetical protein